MIGIEGEVWHPKALEAAEIRACNGCGQSFNGNFTFAVEAPPGAPTGICHVCQTEGRRRA